MEVSIRLIVIASDKIVNLAPPNRHNVG